MAPPRPAMVGAAAVRDADGPRRFGLALLAGDPATRDVAGGLAFLARACDGGSACACLERGAALETFDGRAAALGEAARQYERLCESSSKTRCVPPVKLLAATAFESRITDGSAPCEMLACYNWSQLLARGGLTAPDPADADVLEKRACAGGLARACVTGP